MYTNRNLDVKRNFSLNISTPNERSIDSHQSRPSEILCKNLSPSEQKSVILKNFRKENGRVSSQHESEVSQHFENLFGFLGSRR